MSKELEALEVIKQAIAETISLQLTNVSLVSVNTDLVKEMREVRKELEALKKSPTVEEVIIALSEALEQDVVYSDKTHEFYYTLENTECIMFITETYGDGLWSLGVYLPPHLITMIGKFYESLEDEK